MITAINGFDFHFGKKRECLSFKFGVNDLLNNWLSLAIKFFGLVLVTISPSSKLSRMTVVGEGELSV